MGGFPAPLCFNLPLQNSSYSRRPCRVQFFPPGYWAKVWINLSSRIFVCLLCFIVVTDVLLLLLVVVVMVICGVDLRFNGHHEQLCKSGQALGILFLLTLVTDSRIGPSKSSDSECSPGVRTVRFMKSCQQVVFLVLLHPSLSRQLVSATYSLG